MFPSVTFHFKDVHKKEHCCDLSPRERVTNKQVPRPGRDLHTHTHTRLVAMTQKNHKQTSISDSPRRAESYALWRRLVWLHKSHLPAVCPRLLLTNTRPVLSPNRAAILGTVPRSTRWIRTTKTGPHLTVPSTTLQAGFTTTLHKALGSNRTCSASEPKQQTSDGRVSFVVVCPTQKCIFLDELASRCTEHGHFLTRTGNVLPHFYSPSGHLGAMKLMLYSCRRN